MNLNEKFTKGQIEGITVAALLAYYAAKKQINPIPLMIKELEKKIERINSKFKRLSLEPE